jgi:hypothetical protein
VTVAERALVAMQLLPGHKSHGVNAALARAQIAANSTNTVSPRTSSRARTRFAGCVHRSANGWFQLGVASVVRSGRVGRQALFSFVCNGHWTVWVRAKEQARGSSAWIHPRACLTDSSLQVKYSTLQQVSSSSYSSYRQYLKYSSTWYCMQYAKGSV